MGKLEMRTAIVTGGAKGIGKAISLVLAKRGAKVAVTDLDERQGKAVVDEISSMEGCTASYWHLDVSREKDVKSVFRDISRKMNNIGILVNNAGISGANKPTHQITEKEWNKVISVNVNGVFFCTKHAVPYMKKVGQGSIINLSSIYGIIGAPDLPPYHASKGAVRLMTKTDALLYAGDGIRVNSVHPGYIWTPMVEAIAKKSGKNTKSFKRELEGLHPLGRVGAPEDIANGVAYLASEESAFVTGSELVIDGGYTAR